MNAVRVARPSMSVRALAALAALAGPAASQALEGSATSSASGEVRGSELAGVRAFFRDHCVRCHGPVKHKKDLRLDELRWVAGDDGVLETWQAVADRLEAGEMPPEEEPRPDPARVQEVVAAIRSALARDGAPHPSAVLRRLNRVQYRNTLRDLLGIDVRMVDPTSSFPADDVADGFDNLGEALVMSDYLLRQYLTAARKAVDLATFTGDRPEARTHRMFDLDSERIGNFEVNLTDMMRDEAFLFLNDERAPGDTRGQVLTSSRDGAPVAGWYEFRFEVESKGRGWLSPQFRPSKHAEWQVYRPEDLHRLELYLTAPYSFSSQPGRERILVESIDLPDDQRLELQRRYWLAPGWRVELAFGNAWVGLLSTYVARLGGPDEEALEPLEPLERYLAQVCSIHDLVAGANAPRIVVHAASERGPLFDSWPPASHRLAWGDPSQPLEERVRRFAARAFRRPVGEEVLPYVRLALASPEGMRTAVEAILCSPRFVYLLESEGALDDWALASRLSYFLWNTMPDEELLAQAAAGGLAEPAKLRAVSERMLSDPRSGEFVERFTWAWLGLQNVLDMGPDPMKFPEYHRDGIGAAMVVEVQRFFRHLLDQNLPITSLLDSDFTFVNADLARLYGIEGVATTAGFQRVELAPELRRGGLLGMAAVLTASANGVDTSPVVRGIWVLDRLLGTPPDPAPTGVVLPEPDARGDLTLRELFAKHRTAESCNECHKSIDPLGFALESFDPIGRWRDTYDTGQTIDTAGSLPRGESFEDVYGMKRALLEDPTLFARNLTSRLLTYASGRTLRPGDRREVDRIVATLAAQGSGLRDLVLAVVTSPIFTSK
jgi:mono/diheme cytochrome c family protein